MRSAIGLLSSTVFGLAATAPAYSVTATLGFVVIAVGLHAPAVMFLAFSDGSDRGRIRPAQPNRPGLRGGLHLGAPGHRAPHRLDGCVGRHVVGVIAMAYLAGIAGDRRPGRDPPAARVA